VLDAVASGIPYLQISNAATGSPPVISSEGEADLGIRFDNDQGEELMLLASVATAVNEVTITNAATGANPTIDATGEADTGITFRNGESEEILILDANATAVNEITIDNAATGAAPTITATGDDTNINLDLDGKGTGNVNLGLLSTGGGIRYKRSVLASAGNTTMTSAMSGSVMLLDGATTDFTLPAIGAGDIGMEFWFVATIIATDQTITAGAGDLLTGSIEVVDTAADTDVFVPDVSDDLIITLNGTTTGGKTVGSWCHLVAISATLWWVEGIFLTATETQATPFS